MELAVDRQFNGGSAKSPDEAQGSAIFVLTAINSSNFNTQGCGL
jgi:hypothetical protein